MPYYSRDESEAIYDVLVAELDADPSPQAREHFTSYFASARTTEVRVWAGEGGELVWVSAFPAGPPQVQAEPRHQGEAARRIKRCNELLSGEHALEIELQPTVRTRPSALAERCLAAA